MGVCPHNPMGPVAGAVALNFDVATTNFVIQEEAVGIVPWFEEICSVYPLKLKRRHVGSLPMRRASASKSTRSAAARHPFEQEVHPGRGTRSSPTVASPTGKPALG